VAREFSGANQHVRGAGGDCSVVDFTLLVWANPNASQIAFARFMAGGSAAGVNAYSMLTQANRLNYQINNAGHTSPSSGSPIADEYQVLAVTFDATADRIKFYLSGVLDPSEFTNTNTVAIGLDRIEVGANSGATGQFYTGIIAHALAWDVVLSDNEILVIQNGVNPFTIRNENQVMNLPLYGNDSPEPDFSGNGNIGSVVGATKPLSNPPVEMVENYL